MAGNWRPSIETEFFVGLTGAGSGAKRFKTLLGIETKVANRLTDLPFSSLPIPD
jgi:hypothetical protein